ncbi:serine hydrolase [Ornatilinea apprima]|nr:serine hydrolase [Ornatilinea apprima]
MRGRLGLLILRWLSMALILMALVLTVFELVQYSRIRSSFPPGMRIAGVPVGGLNQESAAERLVQAYGVPVELRYGDAVIQVKPQVVGFELKLDEMLAAADLQRITQPFWSAFWDYLWNQLPTPKSVPLSATISEERLRTYLKNEIAVRYDQPPEASIPLPGTTSFQSGNPGTVLDMDRAVVLIEDALRSPNARVVNLTYSQVKPPRPSLVNLEVLLKQIVDVSGFDGVVEMYMLDLKTREEMNFAYRNGEDLAPGIAFTAASTMKIPIMTSTFRRVSEPTPQTVLDQMALMIEQSENGPADRLMQNVLDLNLGPLQVTEDMQAIGLANTFIAGYFYPGAPLLQRFTTPANSRTDVNTEPDVYNQTTPADLGMLMDDLYQCANNGGGTLTAAYAGQVSQAECQQMLDFLSLNDIAVLIKAGIPEGTRIAHKHGWIIENDGYLHTMGNAAIVYSPAGDYVLVIFMYQPVQLVFDPANVLFANLSRAVYNYYNLE